MATDMFLKIDDIAGESVDSKHKDWIEVQSWSWGMSQTGSAHSGTGSGTGKVSVQDLSVVKYVDRATPNLMKMCCNGKHFKKAELRVRKAGGDPLVYVKIELTDGIVSGVSSAGGTGDERLTETVTLNFATVRYEYTPQSNKGPGDGVVPMDWDIKKNAPMGS
jgi:type VI secretion system secreted protein Hcp